MIFADMLMTCCLSLHHRTKICTVEHLSKFSFSIGISHVESDNWGCVGFSVYLICLESLKNLAVSQSDH